jgi:hypothetical protein
MLYEIEVDHDDESWKVIAKHAIKTEEGFEDSLVAVFYDQRHLNIFMKVLNHDQ